MYVKQFYVHVGNSACKRADVHVTNNNMIWRYKLYEISIKILGSQKKYIYFSPVYCFFPLDYTILVNIMTTLHSCTLRDLFT